MFAIKFSHLFHAAILSYFFLANVNFVPSFHQNSDDVLCTQLQADLLGSPVVRPADIETTALGAAYAAGLAAGVWTKEHVFAGLHKENTTVFRPKLNEGHRKNRADSWYKAVSRSFDLADLSL